jgi:hypothetical protein
LKKDVFIFCVCHNNHSAVRIPISIRRTKNCFLFFHNLHLHHLNAKENFLTPSDLSEPASLFSHACYIYIQAKKSMQSSEEYLESQFGKLQKGKVFFLKVYLTSNFLSMFVSVRQILGPENQLINLVPCFFPRRRTHICSYQENWRLKEVCSSC